jgi:nicotinamidase/pyrazinamidase
MDCLIVIDMLNGFCRPGYPLSERESTSELEKYIIERIKKYQSENLPVIFCCDSHGENDPEFKQYPKHCMKGTIEAEIIDTIAPFSQNAIIVPKTTLSPFLHTDLEGILSKMKCSQVEIVGVYTDICITQAVGELRNRGYYVTVPEKGVMATVPEKQTYFLSYMKTVLGADIETDFWFSTRVK